jgi:uncharacterized protein YfaS (alpha-2-macroglobulin family)
MVQQICSVLQKDNWLSTQETAYALLAVSDYASGLKESPAQVEYRLNGGDWQKVSMSTPVFQLKLDPEARPKGKIEIRNTSATPMNASIVMEGIPAAGKETASSQKLKLKVVYKNVKGTVIDPANLEQGADFFAEISVLNPDESSVLEEMALTAIFPSGWQIHNPNMEGSAYGNITSDPEHMDIRDDRVYFYFDLQPQGLYSSRHPYSYGEEGSKNQDGEEKVFRVALNASFAGKYYMPGVYAEAMYDNRIHASTAGKWVTVGKSSAQ